MVRRRRRDARGWAATTYRSGERGLPWGTPLRTGKGAVRHPLKRTLASVSAKSRSK